MTPVSRGDSDHHDEDHDSQGMRTLSDAKAWLETLGKNGAAQVHIKEPYRVVGGGLLVITASLIREDGARVNVEVYCSDDRDAAPMTADLFPLPASTARPGPN